MQEKVDREMEAALQKYGPIQMPDKGHIEKWYDRID